MQVFGTDKGYWFLPAYSEDDLRRMPALQGLEYPSKPDLDEDDVTVGPQLTRYTFNSISHSGSGVRSANCGRNFPRE
ncbi:putative protein S-acyltransferase 14 [Nymphaea thermarum]|nr:putative protein S-acyltransferase 14 [Nymphaea thermarum]